MKDALRQQNRDDDCDGDGAKNAKAVFRVLVMVQEQQD